uniref:SET domain-containing protein n=1 Tax=Syphacia muris TaxID=451379 RepID=A0A0N5AEV8_9BILA
MGESIRRGNNDKARIVIMMDAFVEWARSRNIFFPNVELRKCFDNSGYGIFAKRNLRENEILITVPLDVMITAKSLVEVPYYEKLFSGRKLKPFEALVVFFIVESKKSENLQWAPYLNVLPKCFSTPAVVDSDLNSEYLPATERELWDNQKKEISSVYKKIDSVLDCSLSYDLFLWAWHIVNSRCICVPSNPHTMFDNSEGDSIAVIPVVDMLNHSNIYQGFCEWNNVMQRYVVTSARAVAEGEQVFVCYGPHTNGRLWIDYGFTLPNNTCNRIPITPDLLIMLAEESGMQITKDHEQAIKDSKLSCTLYSSDDLPSYGYRAAFRILHLDRQQLEKWSYYVYNDDWEDDNNCDGLKLSIQCLHRHYSSKRDKMPKKYQWIWNEYLAILDHYLKNM